MHKPERLGYVLALAALWVSVASAAPNISASTGLLAHGETVTIQGSGFGAKPAAPPLRWETFAAGTPGEPIDGMLTMPGDVSSYWSTSSTSRPYATLSEEKTRGEHRRSFKAILENGSGHTDKSGGITRHLTGFAVTGKVYLNYWVWFDWGQADVAPTDAHWQIKGASLGTEGNGPWDNQGPFYELAHWHYANDNNQTYWYNYWGKYRTGSGPSIELKNGDGNRENHLVPGWYNISLQMNMGSPGEPDGSTRMWTSAFGGSKKYGVNGQENLMILGTDTVYVSSTGNPAQARHYTAIRTSVAEAANRPPDESGQGGGASWQTYWAEKGTA